MLLFLKSTLDELKIIIKSNDALWALLHQSFTLIL